MAHRPDLSDHIVHLTRNGPKPARDNLVSILADQCIEARNPYGIAVAHLKKIACGKSEFLDCQKVTCFSEVPLDYLPGLLDPGVTRNITLQPYGVVFDRSYLIDRGACQVWYANTYPGNKKFKWSANNVNSLIDEAAIYEEGNPDPERWENSAIAQLTPFWETIGQWWKASYFGKEPFLMTKDFAFEREWRYRGSFE